MLETSRITFYLFIILFLFSVHTFETPIPCYLMGRLVWSSTIVKCSGNEKYDYRLPKPLFILRLLQKPGSFAEFAWHSMHKSMMWFLQMAQLSTTISHAHKATAFHFLTSNLFLLFLSPLVVGTSSSTSIAAAIFSTTIATTWHIQRFLDQTGCDFGHSLAGCKVNVRSRDRQYIICDRAVARWLMEGWCYVLKEVPILHFR